MSLSSRSNVIKRLRLSDAALKAQVKLCSDVAEMAGLTVVFVVSLHPFSDEWCLTTYWSDKSEAEDSQGSTPDA